MGIGTATATDPCPLHNQRLAHLSTKVKGAK
jgi:hypothetical protein